MNTKVLKTLEYNKIIELLASFASSSKAKQMCHELLPSIDIEEIRQNQQYTSDALTRIFQKGSVSFLGIHNVESSMKRLEIGSTMGMEELLTLSALLETAKRIKAYSRGIKEDAPTDSLDPLFEAIEPLTPLLDEIKRCILSKDEISDDASSTLKGIRRNINGMNERIHNQLSQMLGNSSVRNILSDGVITMRNGRYCLPVKAESKNQLPGMVHDQSSSGSTLFIEPMAVVNLNNELRELFLKEQQEIAVILANLSNLVTEYIPYIRYDYRILTELDFIFAKGQLAKVYNGTAPMFNERGYVHIRKGRHPLLDKHKVVPIDLILGDTYDLLIVTGPNTGGKTVSLKTVGLFSLMGQAGLHIPANDRSELSIFEEVYADIGDEQSIEQSLSTFSSHMKNIISILENVNEKSLVLFDELCAGTDPTEGAALAISILNRLHERNIRTMATTHYSEIKVYALTTPGVENACCEFNVETLSPTYRLLIGIPGKSNAFAISGKLGLPADVVEEAKKHITTSEQNLEDLIADLESSRITIEKERDEISRYKREVENLKKKLEEKQEKLEISKNKILQDANEKAYQILKEAKDLADTTIRNFNRYGSATSPQEMENERTKLREKMSDSQKDLGLKQKAATVNTRAPKKLCIGDSVKVLSMNLRGTVHTLPNAKGDLSVQMGILRSIVNIKDLILLDEDTLEKNKNLSRASTGKMKLSKASSISMEINLIGKTTDEAIAVLDKYLDDAYLSRLPSVRIVHGKGTGALRTAVWNHLKRQNHIKSYHLGEYGEGDAGVTIAEFQ